MYIDDADYMVYLKEKHGKETELIPTASRGDIDLMQIDNARIHQMWRITTERLTSSMQMQPLAQALRRIGSAAFSSGLEPSQRYSLLSQNDNSTTLMFSPRVLTTWGVFGLCSSSKLARFNAVASFGQIFF